jgi:quinol-cytochrome oxidoreductase complex cytochrome b subunit
MGKNTFSTTDSLRTIEAAINEAKSSKTGASFYYILWGLILSIYFTLHFFIITNPELQGTKIDTFNWVLFPIGGLLSFFNKSKDQRTETNVPQLEKVYLFAFTGFAFMYAVLTFASTYLSSSLAIMLFPLIIGSTVYVVGGISRHKISICSGILSMLLTVLSILSKIEIQFLIASIACILSCIIPGISMRKSNV